MGLLTHLLFWPVTGPSFLIRYSLGKVEDVAREELTDDQSVKEDLLALQMELEVGAIDDDEFLRREAGLMERLREVRRWREEFGMGVAGGPVRVAREPSDGAAEASAVAGGDVAEGPDAPPADPSRGGIASSSGAVVEISMDWDEPGGS